VLPQDYLILAQPSAEDLIEKLTLAISKVKTIDPYKMHEHVKNMYTWDDVAERTERVYNKIIREEKWPLIDRLRRFYGCGAWAGKLFCLIVILGHILWCLLEWLSPRDKIEFAPDFPYAEWKATKHKYDCTSQIEILPDTEE
jgi:phosphatidylinositol glycan class A protein